MFGTPNIANTHGAMAPTKSVKLSPGSFGKVINDYLQWPTTIDASFGVVILNKSNMNALLGLGMDNREKTIHVP